MRISAFLCGGLLLPFISSLAASESVQISPSMLLFDGSNISLKTAADGSPLGNEGETLSSISSRWGSFVEHFSPDLVIVFNVADPGTGTELLSGLDGYILAEPFSMDGTDTVGFVLIEESLDSYSMQVGESLSNPSHYLPGTQRELPPGAVLVDTSRDGEAWSALAYWGAETESHQAALMDGAALACIVACIVGGQGDFSPDEFGEGYARIEPDHNFEGPSGFDIFFYSKNQGSELNLIEASMSSTSNSARFYSSSPAYLARPQ